MTQVQRSDTIFGVPTVLSAGDVERLVVELSRLWYLTYGRSPGSIKNDLNLCKRFFDPVARGQSIRDRLAALPTTPDSLRTYFAEMGAPLTVDAGDGTLIIGPEGRLLLDLLHEKSYSGGYCVISSVDTATLQEAALAFYRSLSSSRLLQTIALRTGKGKEVMQAISVGITLALLVNRATSPARAIVQYDHDSSEGSDIDAAIFAGAEKFAEVVSGSRRGRSSGERRLKGGYALTEARRRLAPRLVLEQDKYRGLTRIYIPEEYQDWVLEYLGKDLARRANLDETTLLSAFHALVIEFRNASSQLAYRSMVFERAGDTRRLERALVSRFLDARYAS